MAIRKAEILSKITSLEIFNFYLQPYLNNGGLTKGKNISNPFLSERQKTPSFNIFPDNQNEWRFKDFATGDEGSCFDLVMKLYNLSFPEALQRINIDLCLIPEKSITNGSKYKHTESPSTQYTLIKRPFSFAELKYWEKFGITEEILLKYKISSILEYTAVNIDGKTYTVKSSSVQYIFAYDNDSWAKIYKPLDKQYRFQHIGIKAQNFIFGLKQLPPTGEQIFITGGEKDVMALAAQGFYAVSLNSETAALDDKSAAELKQRFRNVIVLYDNDETGLKHSDILAKKHNFNRLVLPVMPENGKDIADFFSSGTKESFLHLLATSLQIVATENQDFDKVVFNAVELLEMGNTEANYLMQPIIPQKGTAVLAGKPDTGKSQFARQLCIQLALGIDDFLGFQLTPKFNSAIYVATEDNINATTYLLNKQIEGLDQKPNVSLRFIFADTMDQEEILEQLDKELAKFPADIVVIDSFGDIFTGKDSNNNMAMRNTVKIFDKISKTHHCLILFVHHINKGAYRQAPGQEHIQGGSGLVQKVRLAIQLSEGDGNTRYFTVVKGNYCPKEYKQNAMQLTFSEETFLFKNTGVLVPIGNLGVQLENDPKEEKYQELKDLAEEIFKDDMLSYGTFTQRFCTLTGKSISTAKRAHANLKKLDLITEFNGSYRLADTDSMHEDSEDDLEENQF